MKKVIAVLILSVATSVTLLYSQVNTTKKKDPQRAAINFVPNEKVACQIAEIILMNIYGEENIEKQKPLKATLMYDSVWVVVGVQKEIEIGGVASIEIQKRDCKILKITHGK